MKIKIISDGTANNTKVIDADSGEDLTKQLGVTSITWNVNSDKTFAQAILVVRNVPVEIIAQDFGISIVQNNNNWTENTEADKTHLDIMNRFWQLPSKHRRAILENMDIRFYSDIPLSNTERFVDAVSAAEAEAYA